jgi:hypothetical protein
VCDGTAKTAKERRRERQRRRERERRNKSTVVKEKTPTTMALEALELVPKFIKDLMAENKILRRERDELREQMNKFQKAFEVINPTKKAPLR